jgi:hypothetical protein
MASSYAKWARHAARSREAAAQQPPRPKHVSAEARAVAGAFPARYPKVVAVGCYCHKTIYQGEFITRAKIHALCTARADAMRAAGEDPRDHTAWLARFPEDRRR